MRPPGPVRGAVVPLPMRLRLVEEPGPEGRDGGAVGGGFRAGHVVLVRALHLVRERPREAAGFEVVADQHVRRERDALAGGRRLERQVGVREPRAARRVDAVDADAASQRSQVM